MTDVERARAAFARRAWADAFDAYGSAAAGAADLTAADHERRAICAELVGADAAAVETWELAQRRWLDDGDPAEAARCRFFLALALLMRGHTARAGGWLGRTQALVDDEELDCAAVGYLQIPAILGALESGDARRARELAARATEIGSRFDDPDLRALGTLGEGQALLGMNEPSAGIARLDEVMLSVTAGEVGPIVTGIVYCAVLLACMYRFDLRRASEWTDALTAWCDAQPDLVPYRGQCRVHRSQLAQATGDWRAAMAEAEAARAHLADPPHPALGLAYYQEAELHRLVGDLDRARSEYREASRHGREPLPGLALLDLAEGEPDAAAAAICRGLQETAEASERLALLPAAVEILLAVGDHDGAREVVDELTGAAGSAPPRVLEAVVAHARGAVLLAEQDPAAALAELRRAASCWRDLAMPYERARTSELAARACAALGDGSTAAIELDNAEEVFGRLGAVPDQERVAVQRGELTGTDVVADTQLSAREREVLAHVAAGGTNREIAEALHISQHTVGRHLENIFAKVGVTNRAAATAWAYEHELI